MDVKLRYRGRCVSDGDIAFIRDLIAAHPAASRRALSAKLCQAWNWRQENGSLCDMICRGLMLKLHRAGFIELPAVRHVNPNPFVTRRRPAPVLVDRSPLAAALSDLQPLEFRQVGRRTAEERIFNGLIEQYHYLGYTQPVGEQLKYLVWACDRPIAALGWSSAPRHLGCRDRFIGWSAEARRKNIRFLAYNTRFLILPFVQVKHLASHILGRMTRLLPADWQRIYGHPIYYLETFVDPQRFRGTSYRAANWIFLGRTRGLGK
ncbi:MAG: Druantia anti-phage system protein DruA, partial [Acidobacteriota bacterium]